MTLTCELCKADIGHTELFYSIPCQTVRGGPQGPGVPICAACFDRVFRLPVAPQVPKGHVLLVRGGAV